MNNQLKARERATINVIAKALSDVFRPSYFPLLGFVLLFLFTYLSLLSWQLKLLLLALVYVMTLFLPAVGIYVYR